MSLAACASETNDFPSLFSFQQQTTEWVKASHDTNIPCSNDFSVTGDFGRPCEDKELEQAGLPTDSFSIQNGIIIR